MGLKEAPPWLRSSYESGLGGSDLVLLPGGLLPGFQGSPFPSSLAPGLVTNNPNSLPQSNLSYEEVVEGSLGPGSFISEITAVSVGQFPWQPHLIVWIQMEGDRGGGARGQIQR